MPPNQPDLAGLPLWIQIALTLIFGIGTLLMGLAAYRKSRPDDLKNVSDNTQVLSAAIADMSALRRLADQCTVLDTDMLSLERSVRELTHHVRQQTEGEAEIRRCMRDILDSNARLTRAAERLAGLVESRPS